MRRAKIQILLWTPALFYELFAIDDNYLKPDGTNDPNPWALYEGMWAPDYAFDLSYDEKVNIIDTILDDRTKWNWR